jgi:hypothetical protein
MSKFVISFFEEGIQIIRDRETLIGAVAGSGNLKFLKYILSIGFNRNQ